MSASAIARSGRPRSNSEGRSLFAKPIEGLGLQRFSGHSALELTAIMLSGAAGLKLGFALIAPGQLSRKAAVMQAARAATRIVYGAAAMFLAAAFVEAFWSPLTEVPVHIKYGVGIAMWLAVAAYFVLAGRGRGA